MDNYANDAAVDSLRAEIRALRYELNYAYRGMETLPNDHPARIVYDRTAASEPKSNATATCRIMT